MPSYIIDYEVEKQSGLKKLMKLFSFEKQYHKIKNYSGKKITIYVGTENTIHKLNKTRKNKEKILKKRFKKVVLKPNEIFKVHSSKILPFYWKNKQKKSFKCIYRFRKYDKIVFYDYEK